MAAGNFFRDWQAKLTSLFLAVIIWGFVVTDRMFFWDFSIPLQAVNLPSGKVPANPLPSELRLRFRGRGQNLLLAAVSPSLREAVVQLDLSRVQRTAFFDMNDYLENHPDRLKLPRDFDLEFIGVVAPETVWVSMEASLERELEVKPNLEIRPAPGYIVVGHPLVEPPRVKVSGPRSLVRSLGVLETPYRLVENAETFLNLKLPVLVSPAELLRLDPSEVTVKVDVQSIGTATFKDIPVKIEHVPPRYKVVVIPATVDVVAEGGQDRLLELEARDFSASFDFRKSWRPDVHLYTVAIQAPEGVQRIAKIIPEKVEVVLR